MKKAEKARTEELRPQYQRSDFGTLVPWKFVKRLAANSNVVVLDPEVADLFPNATAVNTALRSLARIAKPACVLTAPFESRKPAARRCSASQIRSIGGSNIRRICRIVRMCRPYLPYRPTPGPPPPRQGPSIFKILKYLN